MITISKLTADVNGSVLFNEKADSDLEKYTARVRRTATLDGGAEIDHLGYAAGDLTFDIRASVTNAQEAALKSIFKNETLVNISTRAGFFKGAISALNAKKGEIKMTFEVKEVA